MSSETNETAQRAFGKTEKQEEHVQKVGSQLTKEQYISVAHTCRDIRKAKEQNELKLTRDSKDNKKGFFLVTSGRRVREAVGLLPGEVVREAELLSSCFNSSPTKGR